MARRGGLPRGPPPASVRSGSATPRIARWIRERAEWASDVLEDAEGGSLVVRHRVADPQWAVSNVLQYGADAEVLEPEDVRGLVLEVAQGLLSSGSAA